MYGAVDALKGGELGAGFEELTAVDLGHADASTKGRADGLARDERAGAGRLRERDVALGAAVVELHRGGGAASRHALDPIEAGLGESGLCLLRAKLGRFDGHVERHEYGARVDELTRLEPDEVHGAGHLVAERDGTWGEDGTDRRGARLMRARGSDGGGDSLHRFDLVCGRGVGALDVAVLPGAQQHGGGEQGGEQYEGTEAGARNGGGRATHGGASWKWCTGKTVVRLSNK